MAKSSGGIRRGASPTSAPRKIVAFKETEKAIQLEYRYLMEYARSASYSSSMIREREGTEKVWIPKSQIENGNLSEWITAQKRDAIKDRGYAGMYVVDVHGGFYDASGNRVLTRSSTRERQWEAEREQRRTANFERARQSRAELVAKAKANGYKAHTRMKTRTLEMMAAGTYMSRNERSAK